MAMIQTTIIEQAVYNLVKSANIKMQKQDYDLVCKEIDEDFIDYFKKNAFLANDNQRPLCQDTGQVVVFLKVPQNITFEGKFINQAINDAVEKCYKENFFRKSVVNDSIFDRSNTKTNTPVIIYSEYIDGENVEINVLIKGGGAENKTKLLMLSPTSNELDIISKVAEVVADAGTSACPPTFLGIGIGGTADNALLLSKKAFFDGNKNEKQSFLAAKMKDYINAYVTTSGFKNTVVNVKILTTSTHIASMPVAISFNCHSMRHARCFIQQNGEILFEDNNYLPKDCAIEKNENKLHFNSSDIEKIKNLKTGEKFFLSGKIYTARDAAHQRFVEMLAKNESLPIDLKDKIIFYAGPCPKNQNEIIGPIGPTTAGRMDKFSEIIAKEGILATIGKGQRNEETVKIFRDNGIKYFTVYGGIANYLSNCVKQANVVAFGDLGAEAVFELEVENFPLVCEL